MDSLMFNWRSTWLSTQKFSRRIGLNEFLVLDQLSQESKRRQLFWNVNKIARKIREKTSKKFNQPKYIFIFSPEQPNKTTLSQALKQTKKKNMNHNRQILIFFSFTFSSSKQPKTNKQKTKKRNTVQTMSDTPFQSPKQNHWRCNQKSISISLK